jgi:hypothetical protein
MERASGYRVRWPSSSAIPATEQRAPAAAPGGTDPLEGRDRGVVERGAGRRAGVREALASGCRGGHDDLVAASERPCQTRRAGA